MNARIDRLHDELNDRLGQLEIAATDEITEAFAQLGKTPASQVEVPYVQYLSCHHGVKFDSLSDAMLEVIQAGNADAELLEALESSQCPLVAKLRDKLCKQWVRDHATAIAEARM